MCPAIQAQFARRNPKVVYVVTLLMSLFIYPGGRVTVPLNCCIPTSQLMAGLQTTVNFIAIALYGTPYKLLSGCNYTICTARLVLLRVHGIKLSVLVWSTCLSCFLFDNPADHLHRLRPLSPPSLPFRSETAHKHPDMPEQRSSSQRDNPPILCSCSTMFKTTEIQQIIACAEVYAKMQHCRS